VDLYPAIDLRAGRCVRLYQGDYHQETAYGDHPVAVAEAFAAAGATWLHVVDLDAARTGLPENRDHVAAIVAAVRRRAHVQAGGGIRDVAAAEALAGAGVARIVLGTAAVEDPDLVRRLAKEHSVAVGIDARDGTARVRGWTEGSGAAVTEVVQRYEDAGVEAVIVTDISRDGTLGGPDVTGLAGLLGATSLDVIASGGVGHLDDLRSLAGIDKGGRRLSGAIVGKALHDGLFTVEEAIAACAQSE
jgi:phosphoribosylformimino-5-aminoimidazole carboxamide ribotide isomerase